MFNNNDSNNLYLVSIRGGKEKKLIKNIKEKLINEKIDHKILDIYSFNEYKGYIWVDCYMDKDLLKFFYNIPEIIAFLNHDRRKINLLPNPISLSSRENFNYLINKDVFVDNIIDNEKNYDIHNRNIEDINFSSNFSFNELVIVSDKDSNFFSQEGRIKFLGKNNAKLEIDFFGKKSLIDIPIKSINKIF